METSNPLLRRAFEASSVEETAPMHLQGVINKTGILLLLCMISASFAWLHPEMQGVLIVVGLLGGLVACLVGTFKPTTSPIAAPAYAVLEGLCLGAISQIFELKYPGIVANAMLLTFSVLGIMLFLYSTRIIRVTERMVQGIIIATASVGVVYLIDIVLRLFGTHVPFLNESGPGGIIISLIIVGIAAFNLMMDFAVIESNVRQGAPKYMEWYCGLALMVTLVWLYLEILRLLSKMQKR